MDIAVSGRKDDQFETGDSPLKEMAISSALLKKDGMEIQKAASACRNRRKLAQGAHVQPFSHCSRR